MNRLIIFLIMLVSCSNSIAQPPQKMSYQMVVRNSANAIVSNQAVGVKISILQGTATGTAVFAETHIATTNLNGLLSLVIGDGTTVTGTFSSIDWSNGTYFIKTETDPAGGANYTISGTTQLLSVPYALYAGNAPNPGKTYLVLEDSITTAEAAIRIAEDVGPNTQFVWIRNTRNLTSVDLSKITNLLEIVIENNQGLIHIGLPNLKHVYSTFYIRSNHALINLSFPSLVSISNGCSFYGNSLSTVSLPILMNANGNISINATQSVSIPLLEDAKGISVTSSNIFLSNLRSSSSLTVNSSFLISFPLYQECYGLLSIKSIATAPITSVSFPSLIRAKDFSILDNNALTSVSFPLLERISGEFNIQNNGSLTNFSMPALLDFGANVMINSNSTLTNISLPSIQRFGGPGFGPGLANQGTRLLFNNNALSSSAVNYLLDKMVNATLQIKYQGIDLRQIPPAPPTGQGLTDKATLQARPNNVSTD